MKKALILLFIIFSIFAVSAQKSFSPSEESNVYLVVDGEAPIVTIIEPKNITYTASEILLNYTIQEVLLDSVWYSLNNGANISIPGPVFLSLQAGEYILTLYANDTLGRINSSKVRFTIVNPENPSNSGGGGSPIIPKTNETENISTISPEDENEKEINISKNKNNTQIANETIKEEISSPYTLITPIFLIIIVLLIIIILIIIALLKRRQKYSRKNKKKIVNTL